jgi:hypothetical protein
MGGIMAEEEDKDTGWGVEDILKAPVKPPGKKDEKEEDEE